MKVSQGVYNLPRWAAFVGWAIAILGGLSALGLSLPIFDMETKTHAASTYATKQEVSDLSQDIKEVSNTLRYVRDNVIRLMERQGIQPVQQTKKGN